MSLLFEVFLYNLLPVFLSAGTGLVLGRALRPDIKTVTQLAFYIFSPCLVFASLTQTQVRGAEFGQLAVFTLAVVAGMALLAALAGLALRLERRLLVTLVVASAFVNSGNYGLAVTRFAFGDQALARAVVFYIFSTICVYTLGVFVSSLGRGSAPQALREIASVPAFYALILAGLVRAFGWTVPVYIDRTVTLLSEAAIPVMLVVLGLQIAAARSEAAAWPRARLAVVVAGTVLQLIVSPLLALALAWLVGLKALTWQAAVLEASMPTAVIATVLALQYGLDAELVTGIVIASTLLSPLTLTPLIAFLQSAG